MILGVSSEIHDTCISVVSEIGNIELSVNEERFTRIKKDGQFPINSLNYKKTIGLKHNLITIPLQSKEDCIKSHRIADVELYQDFEYLNRIDFFENDEKKHIHIGHHASHAASAYYTSGFKNAVIITMDGGSLFEPWCTTIYSGRSGILEPIREDTICFTQNYFFTTALLGFTPNKDEGKITGLAAYGKINNEILDFYEKNSSYKNNLAHQISFWNRLGEKNKNPIMGINIDLLNEYKNKFSHIKREDIAYTIQYFTEIKVLNYIVKNVSDIKNSNIALAGGLFANVNT